MQWLSDAAFTYIFFAILMYFVYRGWDKPVVDKKWFLFYGLGIVGSCIYSQLFNGQNFIRTAANSYPFFGIFSIFLIYYFAPSYKQATKAVVTLSIIWCVCYLIQWIIYPITLFDGANDELNITEDFFRMRMPGSICAYCIFLYGINRWITTKSFISLGYSLLGFVPIFIMGFRSLTAAVVVCAFIMIGMVTRNIRRTVLWAILVAILGYCSLSIPIIGDKMEEMIERNDDDQTFDNQDYIRFLEYDYFAGEFFTKPGEKFFGGGMPVYGKSAYANKIQTAEERYEYFWVDLGLLGLSWIIGIPAVLCLVIILWKGVKRCRAPEIQYLRFTIIATTLASLVTSMEIFRDANLLIVGLYLYIIAIHDKNETIPANKPVTTQPTSNANRTVNLPPRA